MTESLATELRALADRIDNGGLIRKAAPTIWKAIDELRNRIHQLESVANLAPSAIGASIEAYVQHPDGLMSQIEKLATRIGDHEVEVAGLREAVRKLGAYLHPMSEASKEAAPLYAEMIGKLNTNRRYIADLQRAVFKKKRVKAKAKPRKKARR